MNQKNRRLELLMDRQGMRLAGQLKAGAAGLPHDVTERLRAARERALASRKVEVSRPVAVASRGGELSLTWGGEAPPWHCACWCLACWASTKPKARCAPANWPRSMWPCSPTSCRRQPLQTPASCNFCSPTNFEADQGHELTRQQPIQSQRPRRLAGFAGHVAKPRRVGSVSWDACAAEPSDG